MDRRHWGAQNDALEDNFGSFGERSIGDRRGRQVAHNRGRAAGSRVPMRRSGAVAKQNAGRAGMGFSIVAIAAGAVMYWAVTSQGHGSSFPQLGSFS